MSSKKMTQRDIAAVNEITQAFKNHGCTFHEFTDRERIEFESECEKMSDKEIARKDKMTLRLADGTFIHIR